MISRRSAAYSSMIRRASSDRNGSGGGSSLLGCRSSDGTMPWWWANEPNELIDLNQRPASVNRHWRGSSCAWKPCSRRRWFSRKTTVSTSVVCYQKWSILRTLWAGYPLPRMEYQGTVIGQAARSWCRGGLAISDVGTRTYWKSWQSQSGGPCTPCNESVKAKSSPKNRWVHELAVAGARRPLAHGMTAPALIPPWLGPLLLRVESHLFGLQFCD